jgi:surface polysaccharide O-acyltransferase-like enzyme
MRASAGVGGNEKKTEEEGMSQASSDRQIGRSIWAIFAGFLVVLAITLVTDEILHLVRVYPPWGEHTPDGPLARATFYRIAYGILGSYITARLAPSKPMGHALLGGAIGVVVSTLGAIATWNKDLGPHWYPVALIVAAMPCAWLGGKLRFAQLRETAKAGT